MEKKRNNNGSQPSWRVQSCDIVLLFTRFKLHGSPLRRRESTTGQPQIKLIITLGAASLRQLYY